MEKYRKSYVISSFEVDGQKKLRVHSLFNLFQDIADEHAEQIGVGYSFCAQNGLGWVGGAYHLKINRWPVWGERVTIETWPSGTTAACAIRDFKMTTDSGEVLLVATSQWVLIDITRLRPLPIAKHLPHYELVDDKALESDFAKIEVPEEAETLVIFPVHADDIDLNHHVNNALYPTWALDGVDETFGATHDLAEVRISFRRPARLGDTVALRTRWQDMIQTAVLTNADGSVEFARVALIWRAR